MTLLYAKKIKNMTDAFDWRRKKLFWKMAFMMERMWEYSFEGIENL